MADIQSFAPIAEKNARVLILGSMPGKASLDANQYYAHPRNQFWPIMAEILGADALPDYAAKTQMLRDAHIALWDVMKSCYRPGSLDTAIAKDSIVPNDFKTFLRQHHDIAHIFFNGAAAEQAFRRLVLPGLGDKPLTLHRLPSTSPAHAALRYSQKLQSWQLVAETLNDTNSQL